MKLITFLTVFILFSSLFTSCQKEIEDTIIGSDSTINTNPALVKTYSVQVVSPDLPDLNTKDSFKLSYDSQDRLISLVSVDSVSGFKMIYKYSSNSFTLDQTSNDDSPVHEIFYLNSNSFVDSTLQYNEGDTTTEKYIYNSNKQVIRLLEYDYTTATGGQLSATSSYEYDNAGNIITETTGTSITNYTYAGNHPNTINIGLNYYQQPKLLPDSYTSFINGTTLSGTHTYTYDSQNRMIVDKEVFSGGANGYSLTTYTY